MSTYLFTWNPQKWAWDDEHENLDDDVEKYKKQGRLDSTWSSGGTRRIEKGDRIFLMRLGPQKPSGIMASGFALESPIKRDHWSGEADKTALYINLRYDELLHPLKEEILLRSFLQEQIPSVHWTPQASGMSIKPDEAAHLEFLWSFHLEKIGLSPIQYSVEVATSERFYEGARSRIAVNAYERNPRARSACIEYHGCKCAVCSFDFESVFGEIGRGYIQVHHITLLAEIGEEYEVNPLTDLIPVCPNCHAMLHSRTPPFLCEDLRTILEKQRRS